MTAAATVLLRVVCGGSEAPESVICECEEMCAVRASRLEGVKTAGKKVGGLGEVEIEVVCDLSP